MSQTMSDQSASAAELDALLSSASVANAAVPATFVQGLIPTWPVARCFGRVRTVRGVGGDNLALYQGMAACEPGDVLIADLGRRADYGHWGDLMSRGAMGRGIAGLILAGGIRDRADIEQMGFPVFHAGCSPRTAAKQVRGDVDVPLTALADGAIHPGDFVIADGDGIAVVPASVSGERLLEALRAVEAYERGIADRVAAGAPFGEAFGVTHLLCEPTTDRKGAPRA